MRHQAVPDRIDVVRDGVVRPREQVVDREGRQRRLPCYDGVGAAAGGAPDLPDHGPRGDAGGEGGGREGAEGPGWGGGGRALGGVVWRGEGWGGRGGTYVPATVFGALEQYWLPRGDRVDGEEALSRMGTARLGARD